MSRDKRSNGHTTSLEIIRLPKVKSYLNIFIRRSDVFIDRADYKLMFETVRSMWSFELLLRESVEQYNGGGREG